MLAFLKRNLLWAGLIGVLAPLAILLALQYSWLVDLESALPLAQEATLKNYLEAAASAVEYYYREGAQRSLDLPAALFTERRIQDAAHLYESRALRGVRRFFVISYVGQDSGKLFVYDPWLPSMEPPAIPEETRAIYVAAAPWEILKYKDEPVAQPALAVDERHPGHRIIFNPIVDASSRLVGVAGLIVDERQFREEILPMALQMSLPAFFSEEAGRELDVLVTGARQERVGRRADAERALSFVFTDLRVGLSRRRSVPAWWRSPALSLNMTLSIALALALVAGLTLALRAASREMALSRMKGDFVSNVSHELRTPLASMRAFGELLRLGRAGTPEKAREYGEYIEAESRRLSALVDNILDFSRIESGLKTYRFEARDLAEVVGETVRGFEVRLRHAGFRLDLAGPEAPLPPVAIDAQAIAQALGNLLDNAVKYSDGAKEIDVRLGSRDGWVYVSVRDRGIGIAREEQGRVFERFHRVGTGLVHDVKGSGLGLSIVRHIVEAHRGRVTLESEPGRGSTFTIALPVEGRG